MVSIWLTVERSSDEVLSQLCSHEFFLHWGSCSPCIKDTSNYVSCNEYAIQGWHALTPAAFDHVHQGTKYVVYTNL